MAILPQILLALAAIFTATNGLDTFGYWLPGATGPIGATRTTTTPSTSSTSSATPPEFDDSAFSTIVNGFRSAHSSAPALTTNLTLKSKAETCADFYANSGELSDDNAGAITPCEGLDEDELHFFYTASGTNSTTVTTMVTKWYAERCGTRTNPPIAYNFTSPSSVTNYQHFTQLVWQNTTKVGCSYSTVKNKHDSQKDNYVTVCVFSPGGNIIDSDNGVSAYKNNVVDSTPLSSLFTCSNV